MQFKGFNHSKAKLAQQAEPVFIIKTQ